LDYYQVGFEYTIDPPAFRKSNKGVLVLLRHTESRELLMVGNTQLCSGAESEYVRMAQALFFMEHAVRFTRQCLLSYHPWVQDRNKIGDSLKKRLFKQWMPFVLGCDLNCNPDGAAYDVLMGKDIFEEGSTWQKPVGLTQDEMKLLK